MKASEITRKLTRKQIHALAHAFKIAAPSAKRAINRAWETGNYEAENLEECSTELQQIRNQHGPALLGRITANDISAACSRTLFYTTEYEV